MKKSAVLFLAVFLSAANVFAQPVALGIEEAVSKALEENVSVKRGRISLDSAERAAGTSWNSVSPTINGSASVTMPLDSDKNALSLSGSVKVNLAPSIYTTVKNACLNYEKQQMTYDETLRSVELAVRKSFYSILYQEENVKLKQKSLETAKSQYESNLSKFNRGTLSKLDVLSAQVTYQNEQLELDTLKASLDNALAEFKQVIGIPQDTQIELSGSFDRIMAVTEVDASGVTPESYTIASLEKQLEIAQNAVNASRLAAWGPSLSASYTYSATNANGAKDEISFDSPGSISLGASIPLDGFLPWSSGAQSIASKKDTVSDLEIQLENARSEFRVDAQTYMNKINQSLANMEMRRSSIELSQSTYDMTRDAYNHGTKDLLTLQTSHDNLLESKLNLLSEAYNLVCAVLDLENLLGVPFGTLLAE